MASPELVGLGIAGCLYLSIFMVLAFGSSLFQLAAGASLLLILLLEVRFHFDLEKATKEMKIKWEHSRQSIESQTYSMQASEVQNYQSCPLVFPFQEFKGWIGPPTASAGLIDKALSPLLGFRPLCACTEEDIFQLLGSICLLRPMSSQDHEDKADILGFLRELARTIRTKVPFSQPDAVQYPAKRGANGHDFWDLMPVRWHSMACNCCNGILRDSFIAKRNETRP